MNLEQIQTVRQKTRESLKKQPKGMEKIKGNLSAKEMHSRATFSTTTTERD